LNLINLFYEQINIYFHFLITIKPNENILEFVEINKIKEPMISKAKTRIQWIGRLIIKQKGIAIYEIFELIFNSFLGYLTYGHV